MKVEDFSYFLIRILTFPFAFCSYALLHRLGKLLGLLSFYLLKNYRKRTLSNLALANSLQLSQKELFLIAKHSFQNLAINLLEYPRLARENHWGKEIFCENPEKAEKLYQQGKGIIFFCGHQSNWEVLFLEGTSRMKGVAIGRPIKNRRLYRWILSIREKNGGKIVEPRKALREGAAALRKGIFLGIVGDQAMPESSYSFPFLGRCAWNSTAPALLAYKTSSPIMVATTKRTKTGYRIHYSEPLWPKTEEPLEKEMPRLMNEALTLLQESILKNPGEWLWIHNRWKQQTLKILYKRFRQDSLCFIIPQEEKEAQKFLDLLPFFKKLYPREFFFIFAPATLKGKIPIEAEEFFFYKHPQEVLRKDFRFKLVFNFSSFPKVKKFYKNLSAFEVLSLEDLKDLAKIHAPERPFSDLFQIVEYAICHH